MTLLSSAREQIEIFPFCRNWQNLTPAYTLRTVVDCENALKRTFRALNNLQTQKVSEGRPLQFEAASFGAIVFGSNIRGITLPLRTAVGIVDSYHNC